MKSCFPILSCCLLTGILIGAEPPHSDAVVAEPPGVPVSTHASSEEIETSLPRGKPANIDEGLDHAPELVEAKKYLSDPPLTKEEEQYSEWTQRIEMARKQRDVGSLDMAFSNLQVVLDANIPDPIKKTALLEMAFTHQKAKNYPDALKAYGIFLKRYQEDANIPVQESTLKNLRFHQLILLLCILQKVYQKTSLRITDK